MRHLPLLLPLLLAACSAEQAVGNDAQARSQATQPGARPAEARVADAESGSASVQVPAGAPARSRNDILGAVPGPCGSAKVEAFVGQVHSEDIVAALRARSGASAVSVIRPDDQGDPGRPTDARRLNVLLNDSGRIILLDCG